MVMFIVSISAMKFKRSDFMTNQISLIEVELKTRVKVVEISLASKVRS